ncbi:MAG TPA: hypothetical protein VLG14_16305 [Sphingomonas sp.]|nr:hypothetical protein [Sphingomonas sp.]
MISKLTLVALSLTVASLPAAAEEPAPASTEAKPALAADAKKICRRVASTGTRLPKRYCRTKAEWESDAEDVQRDFRNGPTNGSRGDLATGAR